MRVLLCMACLLALITFLHTDLKSDHMHVSRCQLPYLLHSLNTCVRVCVCLSVSMCVCARVCVYVYRYGDVREVIALAKASVPVMHHIVTNEFEQKPEGGIKQVGSSACTCGVGAPLRACMLSWTPSSLL
jgi:hypothetical protein